MTYSETDDYLLGLRFPQKRDERGYVWKVIKDPTRNGYHPGLFYGNLFRMVDFRLDRDEVSTWPDGIIFQHTVTGQQLTFIEGKLYDLTNGKFLVKKVRIRPTKRKIQAQGGTRKTRMRRFLVIRNQEVSDIPNSDVIAEGTVFSDGMSVIRWLREPCSMSVFNTVDDVLAVHGHEGKTQLQFVDQNDPTN
jgi:hypothetical protein